MAIWWDAVVKGTMVRTSAALCALRADTVSGGASQIRSLLPPEPAGLTCATLGLRISSLWRSPRRAASDSSSLQAASSTRTSVNLLCFAAFAHTHLPKRSRRSERRYVALARLHTAEGHLRRWAAGGGRAHDCVRREKSRAFARTGRRQGLQNCGGMHEGLLR
jgi:hypothetical protein